MKALGKKKTVQGGTMVAFACDCIAACKSLAFCSCTTDISLSETNSTSSFGKIVSSTLAGETWFG